MAGFIDYKITITDKQLLKGWKVIEGQLAFAMAGALHDTGLKLKKLFRKATSDAFDFKTPTARSFLTGRKSVFLQPATPDKRLLFKRVSFRSGSEFLSLHESGGTKLPPTGEDRFGIPEETTIGKKRMRRAGIIQSAQLATGGISGGRFFRIGKGTKRDRIIERLRGREEGRRRFKRGKRKGKFRKRRRRTVRTLFWMETKGRIRKALNIERDSQALANKEMAKAFNRRLNFAIRTALRR